MPHPRPRTSLPRPSVVESIESPDVAERHHAARADTAADGAGESASVPERNGGAAPQGPANGNGHDVSTGAEGECGPEPANGRGGGEDSPAEPSIADAIDAMNAVPTADGEPRVIVHHVGPINGQAAGEDPLDIPEFLRRVH